MHRMVWSVRVGSPVSRFCDKIKSMKPDHMLSRRALVIGGAGLPALSALGGRA